MSFEEKKLVLDMRNNENIRVWMYNQDEISLENHLKFIHNLMLNLENQYLLVKIDNNFIGVVYFNQIDYSKKECCFGLYANPNIKNVGNILMQIIIKYIFDIMKFKVLKAEVFSNNEKAINLYQKYAFKEICKKIVTEKEVICMELAK